MTIEYIFFGLIREKMQKGGGPGPFFNQDSCAAASKWKHAVSGHVCRSKQIDNDNDARR